MTRLGVSIEAALLLVVCRWLLRAVEGVARLVVTFCLVMTGAWPLLAIAQDAVTPFDPTPAPVNQPTTPPGMAPEGAPQVPSGVAVGRTRGSFSVSSTGAAQYVIPLWMPPGIAGLQPSLALTYSSRAGDGDYGVGWNLSGLSTIGRCPKTVAQDGLAANVFLTSADLYCLDGNKLRSFAGTTYGADGAQYQTEIADFSLVISHGVAGTGPAWFEVHGKNGLIYHYGNTAHSALLATGTPSVITWALNSITDRFGNHIDFDYTNDTTNQVLRPLTISYTTPPTGAVGVQTQPNYQVQFTFQSRTSPVPSGFVTGAQFMEPYLAQIITIAAWNGSAYAAQRTYNLSYTTGAATGRSTLNSIQECSPTQCFPATTAGYQSGQTGWGSAVNIGGSSHLGLWNALVGDLNGDGIEDILYYDNTTSRLYYLLGTTSGTYQGPYDTGVTGSLVAPIDYNSDGKMDLMTVNSSGNLRINFFSSAGGAFTYTDTTTPAPPTTVVGYVMVGDVDGDGREDLIYAVSSGSSWTSPDYIYYRLNTGSGFGPQQLLATIGSPTCVANCQKLYSWPFGQTTVYNSRVRHADFNGDGRIDFLVNITKCNFRTGQCTAPTYSWDLFVSDASTNTYDPLDVLNYDSSLLTGIPPLIGDFNGDGCSDLAYVASSGQWVAQYGTCLRSGAANALSAAVATGISHAPVYPMAIDWDGDGRDDIVDTDGTTWGYAHSTGTGFGPWTSTGITYSNADTEFHAALAVDVHGDGQYGIVYPTGSNYALTALPHKGAGITQDLATSFTDGFGFSYSPTYAQITNSTYYTKNTGATYPEQDYQGATTVVASYNVSDGVSIGGTYTISQFYGWARMNVAGRGFEGFGYIRSIDSRNGLYAFNYYSLLFPETGMVSEATLSTSSKTYASIINTNTSDTLDATYKRYFPYVSQSVKSLYEYGGALDGTLITQVTTTPAYQGSNGFTYGNPSQIKTTTVDKDPNSPWPGSTFTDTLNITPYETGGTSATGWCIHLPSQVTEQRTQPSGASLTHTTSYGVNQNNECEVDSKTVEPSSNTDKVLTAYLYDGCGNVNSTSVTGQNPDGTTMTPARTTTASYGSHCIFPETITNGLSQASTRGYNYYLGVPTSATDPNLLATSWTYNDIAQKTLEQRPDGTQTSYGLTACASHCGSSTPLEYYLVTQEQDSTGGHTTFRQHYDYYDQLDRVIKDQVQISGGQYADTWSIYDSLGRLAQKSSPYMDGATQYFVTYQYDLLNRTSSMSRPISATNSTLEYTYYAYQGRTGTVQDPKGYITTKQSDVIGELGIVTDPDGVSKTTYAYDPFSHLTQVKDPASNQTNRTYDTLGYLLTGSSDPDRGPWTYQYDSLGELINLRDAKTQAPSWTQTLTWDVLWRTTQRVETEGTTVWTWGTVAANHEIGQLKELSGLSDDELYTYDSAGRPAAHSMTWASRTYTVGYNYNTIGKLNQLTYPLAQGQANPFAVLYTYSNGYLLSLENYTGGVVGTTFWQLTSGAPNMDSWGHVIDETLGTTSAVRIQSAFDGVTSWLNTRTVGSGGSLNNLQNLAYQWDLNGNLSQRQDQIQSLTEAFNYDNLNRIQTSTLNGTQNLSVAIDNTGNITSRTEGGVTYPYTYDTTHKHAVDTVGSVGTYTYDANGNMATRNGYSLTWASYNLPTNINGSSGVYSTLYYGPDRQRKEQVANYVADGQNGTETTIYVLGLYEYEITPGQTHDKYFIQVPGGTQIIYDIQSVSGTQTTYVTADHLGSGNLLLNSAGTVEIKESYSAYGYRRSANWAGPLSATSSDYTTIASTTRRGYTDAFHEMLDNVGLIHMNGRVYDPVIGRFMSPDPVVTQVGDSQRGNPYSYVENRPVTMTDPTGLTPTHAQCIDNCGGWIPHCQPCRLGYDPGSFIGPDIGSLQGISGFDANTSDLSTTGDPVSAGAGLDQAAITWGMTYGYSSSGGQISLSLPDQSGVVLAAAASVASYSKGKVGIDGYTTEQVFTTSSGGTNAVLFTANAGTPSGYNWVLGFQGTSSLSDWGANASNALGTSGQYSAAVAIATDTAMTHGDDGLLTGHSFGGGEAALASVATGIPAITFNAAGVVPSRYGVYGSTSQITNYSVGGEPLSTAQAILPIPGALGQQVIMTPATVPSFGNSFNHGMNAIVPALCNSLGNCGP
jgi:RHS repeat-associated protein